MQAERGDGGRWRPARAARAISDVEGRAEARGKRHLNAILTFGSAGLTYKARAHDKVARCMLGGW